MYLFPGKNTVLREENVIGIFDLDITSQSHITRAFLTAAEKAGHIVNVSEDIPRSFLVCREGGEIRVYLSQITAATLLRRADTLW